METSLQEGHQHFAELQQKYFSIQQQLKLVAIDGRNREVNVQRCKLTVSELDPLPADTNLYTMLGKSFVLESKEVLLPRLQNEIVDNGKEMQKLEEKKARLDAQVKEVEGALKELLSSDEKLARSIAQQRG